MGELLAVSAFIGTLYFITKFFQGASMDEFCTDCIHYDGGRCLIKANANVGMIRDKIVVVSCNEFEREDDEE